MTNINLMKEGNIMLSTNDRNNQLATEDLQEHIYQNLCKNYMSACFKFFKKESDNETITVVFDDAGFTLMTPYQFKNENETHNGAINFDLSNPFYQVEIKRKNKDNTIVMKTFLHKVVTKFDPVEFTKLVPYVIRGKKLTTQVLSEDYYYHWVMSNLQLVFNALANLTAFLDQTYTEWLLQFLIDKPDIDVYLLSNFKQVKQIISANPRQIEFFLACFSENNADNPQAATLFTLLTKELIKAYPVAQINQIVFLAKACTLVEKVDLPALPINYLPDLYWTAINTLNQPEGSILLHNLPQISFKVMSKSDLTALQHKLTQTNAMMFQSVLRECFLVMGTSLNVDDLISTFMHYPPKIEDNKYKAEAEKILHIIVSPN